MNMMHNFGTVFSFEVMRMLKKKSFWAMALGAPAIIGLLFGVMIWSNNATQDAVKELNKETFHVAMLDESGAIQRQAAEAMKISTVDNKQAAVERVKNGDLDGFLYFPADLTKQSVEVYGKDVGLFKNARYSGLAETLLQQSVSSQLTPTQLAVMQQKFGMSSVTYRDGQEYHPLREMIVPGFFLVLFYMLVAFFGSQMLNSTIEEKENRTVEMLLTTVQARTLIVGKILAMVVLALIQGLVILLPVILLYVTAGSKLSLPNFDLTQLSFDPLRIAIATTIFALGFLLFTGLLVAVGAVMPTAKEASQWVGVVFLLIFAPLYGASVFVSYPESPFVQFFSYFPLTAPIPLLLRNAVGNLQLHEAAIATLLLTVSTVAVMMLAVRLFRYGAMAYDSKLSLSALRARRSALK